MWYRILYIPINTNLSLFFFLAAEKIGASKKGLFFVLHLIIFFTYSSFLSGQDRCSINHYEEILNQKFPNREKGEVFEKWMAGKIRTGATRLASENSLTYTIPVVVHIIHNGEVIGSGINISDEQIRSQITVLNNDFKRLNSDAIKTPSDFSNVAGSMAIEFVLAKRNPDGIATNGIVRINGNKSAWNLNDESIFKSLSYWPAEDYLNIWVLNLSGSDIGYASFPVSNLPGMEDATDNRLIDGVIIDYKVFGSRDFGNYDLDTRYNVGRTATHEVGHYLGLRHIWGDINSCTGTDFVEDTPPQNGATFDCPTSHPIISCNNQAKMYQNYMDYTQDACMNLFTKKQIDRMVVVLQNSPRRKSLSNSLGSITPVYTLECSISINSPKSSACSGVEKPSVLLRNLGDQTVNSVKIRPSINGAVQSDLVFSTNLIKGEVATLTFPEITIRPGETITLQYELIEVNGAPDESSSNNVSRINATGSALLNLPAQEKFSSTPSGWKIVNPDGLTGWKFSQIGAGTMTINSFNYEQTGELDALITPVFDASDAAALLLQFDLAYSRYPGNSSEILLIYLIQDCSENFSNGVLLFEKQGSALATAPDSFSDFTPTSAQWRRETIVLNDYIGKSNLRLAFVFKSGFGNNIYLDNFQIANAPVTDLEILGIIQPTPVVCLSEIAPRILLYNSGSTSIEKVSGKIISGGGSEKLVSETSIRLAPGDTTSVTLPIINLNPGENNFSVTLLPIGQFDNDDGNNFFVQNFTRITSEDKIPTRQNFNINNSWTFATTGNSKSWETISTNKGTSATYQSFSNTVTGEKAWLLSPILDLSKVTKASVFANLSYGTPQNTSDQLKIAASTNCGNSFDEVFFDGSVEELVNTPNSASFTPSTDEDWIEQFFDISKLAGKLKVLFSFQITNNNGSNVYVDDIEFFADDNPEPVRIEDQFSVYRDGNTKEEKITFNLKERSTVKFQLFSSVGIPVLENTFQDILNQTLTLNLGLPSGLYIYRFQINGRYYAVRHFIP